MIYEKACEFIETLSNYIYIGYIKIVLPFTTIPSLLMSYFKYYFTDSPPSDAFTLPFTTWCVDFTNTILVDNNSKLLVDTDIFHCF